MTGLTDSFSRPITYLRISVTDRCNLRCLYCMPSQGLSLAPRKEMLRYEEIYQVVAAAAELGVHKVRLTGGEPLVRADILELVAMLGQIPGLDDLGLTTNGILLRRYAASLKEAGLKRVNVSLDTLREERFRQITGRPWLPEVLAGIEAAYQAGLRPVKINMVVLRGVNDDEVLDFARSTMTRDWHVRFIELMPFGEEESCQAINEDERFVSAAEVQERLSVLGPLEPHYPAVGGGPARYFRYRGAVGTIGFISPVSEHFCFGCNRMRLTADGRLRPCLLDDREIDLRTPLRHGATEEELKALLARAVWEKPEHHRLKEGLVPSARPMRQIGG
ncbi:MAG: GTP 3',8-cyclase MoaA [Chloroflexi bacterium]|nr:GTP 3',8-cyclase MoaA [Chloroflexota bacterium]